MSNVSNYRFTKYLQEEGPSLESTDTEEEPFSNRTSAAPSPAPSQRFGFHFHRGIIQANRRKINKELGEYA